MTDPPSSAVSPPRLSCTGIEVNYGGLLAVNDVSVSLPAREIVGLVGPNGAGKSTLFGVLSGLIQPSRGEVFLDGENVTNASPQARAERGLARTFQHPEIFGGLTIRQHFVLAHRIKVAKKRTWSDLFTLGSLRSVDPEEKKVVDDLVDTLGLGPIADRLAAGQPLGVSRLVELGRALATVADGPPPRRTLLGSRLGRDGRVREHASTGRSRPRGVGAHRRTRRRVGHAALQRDQRLGLRDQHRQGDPRRDPQRPPGPSRLPRRGDRVEERRSRGGRIDTRTSGSDHSIHSCPRCREPLRPLRPGGGADQRVRSRSSREKHWPSSVRTAPERAAWRVRSPGWSRRRRETCV